MKPVLSLSWIGCGDPSLSASWNSQFWSLRVSTQSRSEVTRSSRVRASRWCLLVYWAVPPLLSLRLLTLICTCRRSQLILKAIAAVCSFLWYKLLASALSWLPSLESFYFTGESMGMSHFSGVSERAAQCNDGDSRDFGFVAPLEPLIPCCVWAGTAVTFNRYSFLFPALVAATTRLFYLSILNSAFVFWCGEGHCDRQHLADVAALSSSLNSVENLDSPTHFGQDLYFWILRTKCFTCASSAFCSQWTGSVRPWLSEQG